MAESTDRDARGRSSAGPNGGTAGHTVADELAAARREELAHRPEHLRVAVATLRQALTATAGDEDDRRRRLAAALQEARERLAAHNAEAEGPDGLLSQVLHDAAWLSPRVHAVAQEHDRLLADCERLCADGRGDGPLAELAGTARAIAARIEEHRHHGTELLMDAYGLDVSAGD
jgi:hypothetical protein